MIYQFWIKISMLWQNLSGKNAPKVSFCNKKSNYSKSNEFERKKSVMNHDSFWHQKLPSIILIPNTYFNFFLELNNMTVLAKVFVPYRKTKSQLIHHFNMVHPRDISLTESWGSSRFFNLYISFNFFILTIFNTLDLEIS